MMTPQQIDDQKYRTGQKCGTPTCTNIAGTFKSRWYCPACDAQRVFSIDQDIEQARADYARRVAADGQ